MKPSFDLDVLTRLLNTTPQRTFPSGVKFTRNDVDLLELVTALHLTGAINNTSGNLTRSEAIAFFENVFGLQIKDAESKLSKATDRKRNKHPFLDELVQKFHACDYRSIWL